MTRKTEEIATNVSRDGKIGAKRTQSNQIRKQEGTIIDYRDELTKQKQWLEKLHRESEKRLSHERVEECSISFSKRKNGFQYYTVDNNGRRKYIKKSDLDKVRNIIQHEYDVAVNNVLEKVFKSLDSFLKKYDTMAVAEVYEQLCDARKSMVIPIIPSDESFIEQWKTNNPGNMNTYPEYGFFLTDNGEKVRSKSEKILADLFEKKGIPYVYEPQFMLANGKIVYPDFALLNISKRKTVYWEHLGLISDGEYATKALKKLSLYERNGLRIGEELVITMESEDSPLDIKHIEEMIARHLN